MADELKTYLVKEKIMKPWDFLLFYHKSYSLSNLRFKKFFIPQTVPADKGPYK